MVQAISAVDHIVELAQEIAEECPHCAASASEIIMWADEIRERWPSCDDLRAIVETMCGGALPESQRRLLTNALCASNNMPR
jgi:hypothetical protein